MKKLLMLSFVVLLGACAQQKVEQKAKKVDSPVQDTTHSLDSSHSKRVVFDPDDPFTFDWGAKITLNGIPMFGEKSKAKITKQLGAPQKIYTPEYECGFLAESDYKSLKYNHFIITGNEEDSYLIEKIDVTKLDKQFTLKLEGVVINKNTTYEEIIKLLKIDFINNTGQERPYSIMLGNSQADDRCSLYFDKNDKLEKIEYWSPC